MKKRKLKKDYPIMQGLILPILLFVIILSIVVFGLRDVASSTTSEGLRIAKDSIHRAAVSCYAVEGAYPESYEYLKENYGLAINEERYIVHYLVYGSNMMPEIDVLLKEGVR
ncbi:hypothetical protein LJC01_01625 [Clostridiaceae bacterium OttesenSCG-928-D20]|nr:hypothetical protein [Clostridiaceae bacterium OttesenSCG-928-D20]